MARIVFGAGCSHSPLLTLPSEEWAHRSAGDYQNPKLNLSDGRLVTYQELLAETGPKYEDVVTGEALEKKGSLCQSALDRLADELEAAAPDIVIIVGDDQKELFTPANQPLISIYFGEEVVTTAKFGKDDLPGWVQTMAKGYLMDQVHRVPGAPAFALEVIEGLLDCDIDIATSSIVENPDEAGFGHAYGFIVKRLFKGRVIPVLPILLNTYYPPNVPSAARTYDIGRALGKVIAASPSALRIAIIGSGGLSHFVVDEVLDRRVIAGLTPEFCESLRTIPRGALNSGSSEILNWVLTAGAVEHLKLDWCEYVPAYRTPAGTGVGIAFAVWKDASNMGGP